MTGEARLGLRLEMLSDWAVGTGTGRQGSLDSIAERDPDGFPVIPATSLRGMWRDAVETVASGLDDGRAGPWTALLTDLFGSQPAVERAGGTPVASRLSVGEARYPSALRDFVRDNRKRRFRDALVFVRPGVKIDRGTGSAEQDHLRFDEVARAGAVLEADCRVRLSGDPARDQALLALAVASLVLLERIGGDRRRGRGACRVSIGSIDAGTAGKSVFTSGRPDGALREAVDWLAATERPAAAPAPVRSGPVTAFARAGTGGFLRYRLDVELLSPACIAEEVQGNMVTTLKSIPGSLLLGAVFPHLAAATGLEAGQLRTMIANGDLRVLDARPPADGMRSSTAPFILEARKENPREVRNKLFGTTTTDSGRKIAEQHKPLRGVMVAAEGPRLVLASETRTVLKTHNTVDDQSQKPTEAAGGGVFVLEAMAAGTTLVSEIWLRETALNAAIEATASVGRAKNAGYGRIRIAARAEAVEAAGIGPSRDGTTVIWARSDIVLPPGCVSAAEAVEALLEEHGLTDAKLCDRSETRLKRVEGWVSAWGLPRPTITAIAAGSTIVLRGDVQREKWASLAREGLGDRRAEGFGEVTVNDEVLFTAAPEMVPAARRDAATGPSSAAIWPGGTRDIAEHVSVAERAAVEAMIADRAELATGEARNRLGWKRDTPGMSQIGRLRETIGDCGERGRAAASRLLDAIAQDGDRAEKWGGRRVVEETRKFIADPIDVWEVLAIPPDDWNGALVSKSAREAREELRSLALLFLLRAVIRAHKRNMEMQEAEDGA